MAAAAAQELFPLTTKFRESIALMNAVDKQKFPLLLGRILRTLHLKNESAFNETEQQQLVTVLGLSDAELHNLLESCSFVFEQCVYFAVSANTLATQLDRVGLDGERIKAFHKVWEDERERVLGNFREQTLMPSTLETSSWSLHLQLAQATYAKVKSPSAVFEFNVSNKNATKDQDGIASNDNNKFKIELNHEQLFEFYSNLEKIQGQLDALV